MRPRVPLIDWKREYERLDPYLRSVGGVVQIRTPAESPASAFTKALRSHMEHQSWQRRWQTIQIDGNNAATHYLSDMVTQFERSLGLSAETPLASKPTIQVASNIEAAGNVEISDISVNVAPDSGAL